MIFSVSDICAEALENALKIARKEFAVIEENSPLKKTADEGDLGQRDRNLQQSLSRVDSEGIREDV